ncbi:HIT family protein [Desulfovibrio sp. OttesenSCG-928-C14]|nr:HIT family protein [Desulfovibrio sp. OttesenSCG-928-C14]
MDNCIFCKIIKGEIPCSKVYEDDKVLAFLDLNPASPGHTLLVPKAHAATLLDLGEGFAEAVLAAQKKIGNALMQAAGAEGFNCLQNNFAAAGQEVFHLHWHIIPRTTGDGAIQPWKPGKYEDMGRMSEMAERLNRQIQGK